MSDTEDVDLSPDEGDSSSDLKSPKKPFTKLAVELGPEDLQSPGVQKMLLAEISRLEHQAAKYEANRDLLASADKKVAVLEETNNKSTAYEVLYSAGLAIGSGLIGLTPSISSSNVSPLIVLAFGVVLIGIAVTAKWRQK